MKTKLQKRERTCRAYTKVLKQCFCPICLLLFPLFLHCCMCPGPSPAACTFMHCHTHPPSLCFLLYWVTAWHSATKYSLRQREVILVSWGGFFSLDVFLCCSPLFLHWQLWCVLSITPHSLLYVYGVYLKLHAWMHKTTIQANILFFYPFHYTSNEGFTALFPVFFPLLFFIFSTKAQKKNIFMFCLDSLRLFLYFEIQSHQMTFCCTLCI